MRRLWIVVALITLIVGIAAGYFLGRSGGSNRPGHVAAQTPIAADAPETATPSAERPATQRGAGDKGETARPRAAEKKWGVSIESLTSKPSSAPSLGAPGGTSSASPAPAGSTGGPGAAAPAPAQGTPDQGARAGAPPVIAPSVPAPGNPPVAPSVSKQDPAKPATPPAPADDPDADRRPPVLQYLRFDPPEIQDGGSAVLSVGVTDDLSGVKSVFGTIRSPSEKAVMPFVGQDAGGTGVFTVAISIPHKAETGDWFVGTLQIIDKADNPLNVAYLKSTVPPGGALRVVSPDSDSTAPTVHGVTVDKPTVGGGESNKVVVLVDDDSSGVASVTGAFQSPSKVAYVPFSCQAAGEGTWAGMVTLPAKADCGEWTLRQLRVADEANNFAFLLGDSAELGHVSFSVASGSGCDSEPPILDHVDVAPAAVSNTSASEVVLTIAAHDDGSGVKSVTGRVDGPAVAGGQVPRIYFGAQPDPKNPDAPMVVRITIPQHAANGIWRVASLELTDKANNMRAYGAADPILYNATITVE